LYSHFLSQSGERRVDSCPEVVVNFWPRVRFVWFDFTQK
jgi:hypothetical protein